MLPGQSQELLWFPFLAVLVEPFETRSQCETFLPSSAGHFATAAKTATDVEHLFRYWLGRDWNQCKTAGTKFSHKGHLFAPSQPQEEEVAN